MFYRLGIEKAAATVKIPHTLQQKLLRVLEHPVHGEQAIKIPLHALLGGAGGLAAGYATGAEHPWRQAALGTALGGMTSASLLSAPNIRDTLIRSLRA